MKRLLLFLITLLGLGTVACDEIIGRAEYGVPHVRFSLKARVVDESGNPIKGIRVEIAEGVPQELLATSDEHGYVDACVVVWPGSQNEVRFMDVDGEANGGEFETLQLNIEDRVVQNGESEGHWYQGSFEAELGDVTMKLKSETPADEEETPEQ